MMISDLPAPVQPFLVLLLAVAIDVVLGEPPDRLHPTVWMGRVISYLKPKARSRIHLLGKIKGALVSICVIGIFSIAAYLTLFWIKSYIGGLTYVLVVAFFLKPTFAIRCMHRYTGLIASALDQGDVDGAREWLPYIVRRNPASLGTRQILSATVESIAEGTADGATSPLFYFSLFGVPGAVAFRAINTLDSMVGYKDPDHVDIGWFSAKLDTIANYVPVRVTSFLMVISAMLLREDWRSAWRIMLRDRHRTQSINAGWSMGAMAGALGVRLEKSGHYILGDPVNDLSTGHIVRALRVMTLTIVLFGFLAVLPVLFLVTVVG